MKGSDRDAAWTLLGYFNSLKELGGSVSLLQVIAPETMGRLAAYRDESPRPVDTQIEIPSRIGSELIGETLAKLKRRHDVVGAIDVALATNMISVGVDVGRLGLMVVDGQPKGISECIQATSRVGRDRTDGLVLSLFTAYRPRDRSRFETHATWHSALYRDVESTSFTPFAPRARSRALHGPFVAIAAHRYPELWQAPGRAGVLRQELECIIDEIVSRVGNLGEQEACESAATRAELNAFLDGWCDRDGKNLQRNEFHEIGEGVGLTDVVFLVDVLVTPTEGSVYFWQRWTPHFKQIGLGISLWINFRWCERHGRHGLQGFGVFSFIDINNYRQCFCIRSSWRFQAES